MQIFRVHLTLLWVLGACGPELRDPLKDEEDAKSSKADSGAVAETEPPVEASAAIVVASEVKAPAGLRILLGDDRSVFERTSSDPKQSVPLLLVEAQGKLSPEPSFRGSNLKDSRKECAGFLPTGVPASARSEFDIPSPKYRFVYQVNAGDLMVALGFSTAF